MMVKHSCSILLAIFVIIVLLRGYSSTPTTLHLQEIDSELRNVITKNNIEKAMNKANEFLRKFDQQANKLQVESGEANWNYETDLTDEHLKEVVAVGERASAFYLNASTKARSIKSLDLPANLSRQVGLIARTASPSEKSLRVEISTLVGNMTKLYGAATVKQTLTNGTVVKLTNGDLSEIFVKSRNRTLLDWAWKEWREVVGPPMKQDFTSLIDFLNIGAREHSWIDYGSFLRSDYEMSDLEENLDEVWEQIEPLYRELHAYVRHKLSAVYELNSTSCLPASLLGDTFAQNWENIFDLVKPSNNSRTFDVTKQLHQQNYTVNKMFRLAESFFTSIGLDAMPESFWNNSVLVKPDNKEMVCHASAWDVSNSDVRIKMCTRVNQKDLTTIHHEMGHVEYFLAYRNQPTVFRAGANPGFHEAIGDTISLSVETPSYLNQVGLLNETDISKDDEISFLLNQALRRIAPIPYNLVVDKWRWKIYEGVVTEETYNEAWWSLRKKYQGVEPPVPRSAHAFDPASKYHIGANVPYVPYFISYILQFQLHNKLCQLAKHKGPLYLCSIYNSTTAGAEFKKLLSAGRSQPWPKLLKMFSGEQTLKADAILKYFDPLNNWLKKERKNVGYPLHWPTAKRSLLGEHEKLEGGHERSSITKADDDKATLSFNVPPDALKDLLKNYPEIKQQYDGGAANLSTASQPSVENATNPSDSQMAAGNPDLHLPSPQQAPHQQLNHNDLSKLLTVSNTPEKQSSKQPVGASLENTSPQTNEHTNSSTAMVDKTALVNTIQNLLQNNVSIFEQDKKPGLNTAQNMKESNTNQPLTDSKPTNIHQNSGNTPPDEKQKTMLPLSALTPLLSTLTNTHPTTPNNISQIGASLLPNNIPNLSPSVDTKTSSTSDLPHNTVSSNGFNLVNPAPLPETPSKPPETPSNEIASKETPSKEAPKTTLLSDTLVNPESKNPNTKLMDQASKLSKDELLGVLKGVLSNQQQQTPKGAETAATTPELNKPSFDYLNLPKNNTYATDTQQQQPQQQANNTLATATQPTQDLANEDITNGLKKLLGMTDTKKMGDEKINLTTFGEDGSKFTKLLETCVRSSDDPKCLHGKIINEGGYLEKAKKGGDDSKQSISISPSALVQKLMEHKDAVDSTPDAVDNSHPSNVNLLKTPTETDQSNPQQIMSLLQKALAAKTTSTRQDVATNNNINKTMCNKMMKRHILNNLLSKRGFSIKYDCNNLLSNFTHVGLTGKSPVSTSDLLKNLIKESPNDISSNRALPPTHLQKTANGFQVDFDLHVKDQIPKESVSGTLKTLSNGRQQHIDLYKTPNGVVMKPKSSVQLLKPEFVPIAQNRDNIELRKTEKKTN